jgi:polar amino acid transport system substrate-binding protein
MKKFIINIYLLIFSSANQLSFAEEFNVILPQEDPWAFPMPLAQTPNAYSGILIDLLKEFEKRSGHHVNISISSPSRTIVSLQEGRSDFSIMIWVKNHDQYAIKGINLFPIHIGIRAKKGVRVIRYNNLKEITTSIPRGLEIETEFDQDKTLKKDEVLDYTVAIKKTALNRDSQAVAGSLATINYIIKKLNLKNEFGDTFLLGTTHLSIHFSKNSLKKPYYEKINGIFKTMLEDGTVRDIHQKWMN